MAKPEGNQRPPVDKLVTEGVNLSYRAQQLLEEGKENLAEAVSDVASQKLDKAHEILKSPPDHKNRQ